MEGIVRFGDRQFGFLNGDSSNTQTSFDTRQVELSAEDSANIRGSAPIKLYLPLDSTRFIMSYGIR